MKLNAKEKKTIRDLKADLAFARECKVSETKRAEAWKNYAWDLEKKLEVAIDRLKCISDGSYYVQECSASEEERLRQRKTAIHGLVKIARMQERRP